MNSLHISYLVTINHICLQLQGYDSSDKNNGFANVYYYKRSDWRDLMDQIGFNNRHLLDKNAISNVSGEI